MCIFCHLGEEAKLEAATEAAKVWNIDFSGSKVLFYATKCGVQSETGSATNVNYRFHVT